ncbi:Phytanoyl-CoA dioxygenase [Balamuthia mandrillaris]
MQPPPPPPSSRSPSPWWYRPAAGSHHQQQQQQQTQPYLYPPLPPHPQRSAGDQYPGNHQQQQPSAPSHSTSSAFSSSLSPQSGMGATTQAALVKAMPELRQMFPSLPEEILLAVFESKRGNVQATVEVLMEMMSQAEEEAEQQDLSASSASKKNTTTSTQQQQLSNNNFFRNVFQQLLRPSPRSSNAASSSSSFSSLNASYPSLSLEQKREMLERGFVVVEGVVPKQLRDAALRQINKGLGDFAKGKQHSSPLMATINSGFSPDISLSPVMSNLLYKTSAIHLAESLIGRGKVQRCHFAQMAIRFPGDGCLPSGADQNNGLGMKLLKKWVAWQAGIDTHDGGDEFIPIPNWERYWHIDGIPNEAIGEAPGVVKNFTCLLGVLLSDVSEDLCGNLCVYPGSHKVLESYFNAYGGPSVVFKDNEHMKKAQEEIQPNLSKPVQIKGKAGDIILCHYQLAHCIAPNLSPNIRYVVYFRLHHRNHPSGQYRPEAMSNIWLDWEGIVDLLH